MASKKPSGLGRGLGALLGDDVLKTETAGALYLPISEVESNSSQPRKNFDEEALAQLADSIREHGIIQPLTVRKLTSGYYQIIAGERRWRAARLAGLQEVPVTVIEADDRKAAELAMIENLQREDLDPIEEAMGYQTLTKQYHMTQEEAAQRVGKSRTQPNRAAHGRAISKLHADDMPHAFLRRMVKICIESLVGLKLPQRCHRTNDKFILCLLNLIQIQAAQINGSGNVAAAHFYPAHTAQYAVRALLICLPRFFQRACLQKFSNSNHIPVTSSLVFSRCFAKKFRCSSASSTPPPTALALSLTE